MTTVRIEPAERIQGSLRVPGDKSVSHRALILAAMARGKSRVVGCAPGEDVASTERCLSALGVAVRAVGRHRSQVEVEGPGWNLPVAAAELDAGNSATTMRLLTGALAGHAGLFVLSGDRSLRRRPMDRVADPLRVMGAAVKLREGRYPPVTLAGGSLEGISFDLPHPSAQVKGAVLLAALQATGRSVVYERLPSRDHTERLLSWLGVDLNLEHGAVSVERPPALPLPAFELVVPGDFSSAAFALVACALLSKGDLVIEGVGINPSRTGLLDILRSMGGDVRVEPGAADPEPTGVIRVRPAELHGAEVAAELYPRTADELPLVAVAATRAHGTTTIRGAAELRVKESDRISGLVSGLRALGASVEEFDDGMAITGPTSLRGGQVDPRGDHRLALAFAVAGLVATGAVEVSGWECTGISYPGFLDDLKGLLS